MGVTIYYELSVDNEARARINCGFHWRTSEEVPLY